MDPYGPVWGEEFLHLEKTITHHREPNRVFERIVVVQEALLCVERWVYVNELHFAEVLISELRQASKTGKRVERVTPYQEVVAGPFIANVSNGGDIVEEPDLSDPVVRRANPLVRAVLVRQQAEMLVRPRQLEAAFIYRTCHVNRPVRCAVRPWATSSNVRHRGRFARSMPRA